MQLLLILARKITSHMRKFWGKQLNFITELKMFCIYVFTDFPVFSQKRLSIADYLLTSVDCDATLVHNSANMSVSLSAVQIVSPYICEEPGGKNIH